LLAAGLFIFHHSLSRKAIHRISPKSPKFTETKILVTAYYGRITFNVMLEAYFSFQAQSSFSKGFLQNYIASIRN
jgi:hypothetical protein